MNVIELERADALRDRLRKWSGEVVPKEEAERAATALPQKGRRFRFVLRVVIAVISALSGGLLFAFLNAIGFPLEELSAALICIGASELARSRFGWRHTGAEEGWMLAGSWLVVFALPNDALQGDAVLLMLGAATLVAGLRVRAPLFAGVAVLFGSAWLGEMLPSGELTLGFLLGGAVATALIRRRTFLSPFVETSLVWTQLALVIAAGAYALDQSFSATTMVLLASGLLVVIGLTLRDTITLWSTLVLVVVSGYEIGRLMPLPLEWRYLLGGLALIVLTVVAERALHNPVLGWTSRRFDSGEGLLELAATVSITPARTPAGGPEDGGGFGGGGATEGY